MQRGVLHHDAADRDGIELGDGGERAGAAHLDVDIAQDRGRLLGGEFVGAGEAGRAGDEAEPPLEIEAVELVDDAVDVVVEAGAAALDIAIGFKHFLDRAGEPDQGIEGKAPRAQDLIDVPLGLGRQVRHLAPAIGEEAQRPLCRDGGIELAERACRGVARIGEKPLALPRLLLVEALKGGAAHIDLAAKLERIREARHFDAVRNIGNG